MALEKSNEHQEASVPIAYLNIYTVPYINIDMINLYVAVIQSAVTLTGGYLLYQNYLSNHDTNTGIVKCTFQDIFNLKKKKMVGKEHQ